MEHQDWTPVILKKSHNSGSHNSGNKMQNKPQISEEDDFKKEIELQHKIVELIQQGRLSKGMKQIDLGFLKQLIKK